MQRGEVVSPDADGRHEPSFLRNATLFHSTRYEDSELNCRQYSRLYAWDSARRVCNRCEADGDYPPTMNAGSRSRMAGSARIPMTMGRWRIRRCRREAIRASMAYSVKTGPKMATMRNWKSKASTGRRRRAVRTAHFLQL